MALLEVDNVSMRFGGLRAVSGVSLALDPGQLVGLIGPNGAGKTTVFNVVTGVYRPTEGGVRMGGRSIAGTPPFRISRAGVARTFQNIRLFAALSVLDNVLVGFHRSLTHGFWGTVLRTPHHHREEERCARRALDLLDVFGLAGDAGRLAGELPYGDQRRLEIARALATDPRILLLDEPAAGMNPAEKVGLMEMIRLIRDRFRLGILLIEHDMTLVMSVCERITVLDHGETIAVGTPEQVRNNPAVIEAYLGEPA